MFSMTPVSSDLGSEENFEIAIFGAIVGTSYHSYYSQS